jgi:hypothetical protein
VSAAHRSSSTARRSLLTATAAGALLGALWFVPSANATADHPTGTEPSSGRSTQVRQQARATSDDIRTTADGTTDSTTNITTNSANSANSATDGTTDGTRLADTGSFDTTPYVAGGTLFLTVGAGFVVYSVRRERLGF